MDVKTLFREKYERDPSLIVRAPGRVNLIGEHVDYNGGPVMPVAIDRVVHVAAAPHSERVVTIMALDLGEQVSFHLDRLSQKEDLDRRPLPVWARYPAGVAWSLLQAGYQVQGMVAAFTSNIPIGAGLGSSAAVEVGFATIWRAMGGWQIKPLELARLCQRAENSYVGVLCGLMDQFTSICGVEGHALYFDNRSLEYEPIQLPKGTAIVIADSGVRRNLTDSGYNERRESCGQAVELLRRYLRDLRSLREVSPQEYAAYSIGLPDVIRRRGEHVVKEIARVQSALNALRRQDERAFGALMYASHTSLREDYEVSTPELDTLVNLARKMPGIIGARLTGAGFGGCTVNLVHRQDVEAFITGMKEGYLQATGIDAQVFVCRASPGASIA